MKLFAVMVTDCSAGALAFINAELVAPPMPLWSASTVPTITTSPAAMEKIGRSRSSIRCRFITTALWSTVRMMRPCSSAGGSSISSCSDSPVNAA